MVERLRGNRVRLGQIVGEDLTIGRFLVGHVIRGEQVMEVAMELVSPIKNILWRPGQPVKRRRNESFIWRQCWLAIDKGKNLQSRLFDHGGVVTMEQGFRQVGVTEVDAIELFLQLGELPGDSPIPRAAQVKVLVPLFEPIL